MYVGKSYSGEQSIKSHRQNGVRNERRRSEDMTSSAAARDAPRRRAVLGPAAENQHPLPPGGRPRGRSVKETFLQQPARLPKGP